MQIALTAHVDAPIDLAWTVLAGEFVQISTWMTTVIRSYELPDATPIAGAPVSGRVCTFTDDPDGLQAHERIVYWSDQEHRLDIDVVVKNAPAILPVARNVARFELHEVAGGTEIRLFAEPTLKPLGYVLYPMIKHQLGKQFGGLLGEFKNEVEGRRVAA